MIGVKTQSRETFRKIIGHPQKGELSIMTITYTLNAKERAAIQARARRWEDMFAKTGESTAAERQRLAELHAMLRTGKRTVACSMPSAEFMARLES